MPGILKRQKFKWTSPPVIRRPESLWKMSYGYFWRTKCSVSPQGKPWIAGFGITWKEGLPDALGTCHWRSAFLFTVPQISIRGSRTKGLVCLWILLWKINILQRSVGKFILVLFKWLVGRFCGESSLKMIIGNSCCGLGVHKEWRIGGGSHMWTFLYCTWQRRFLSNVTPLCMWESLKFGLFPTRADTCSGGISQRGDGSLQQHGINASYTGNCVRRVYGNAGPDNVIQSVW